jgi:hypothetical protein
VANTTVEEDSSAVCGGEHYIQLKRIQARCVVANTTVEEDSKHLESIQVS